MGRFSIKQLLIVSGTLLAIYVLWSLVSGYQSDQWYLSSAPCETPKAVMRDIEELAIRSHHVLDELKIPHFLCFGSLWGAIRSGTTLSWDNNLDLCTVDEHINQVDASVVYDAFSRQGIALYHSSRDGHYELLYKEGRAYLTVYHRFYTDMERTGWGRSFLPFLYSSSHSFPARLVQLPFPVKKFHTIDFPVPHEDFELQKYLYPGNWWKEMKPVGC